MWIRNCEEVLTLVDSQVNVFGSNIDLDEVVDTSYDLFERMKRDEQITFNQQWDNSNFNSLY